MEDARVAGAVAVPVAHDGLVVGTAELEHFVLAVDHAVAIGVDVPGAVAVHAQLLDAIAVEVADDGHVPLLAEVFLHVGVRPLAVAVDVAVPAPVAEYRDRVDAVAVPVADHWVIARRAIQEDVVDHVFTPFAGRRQLQLAVAHGRAVRSPRNILVLGARHVIRIGQAGLVGDGPRIA